MSAGDKTVLQTPWFSVLERPTADGRPYYLLTLPDYVSVIAVTRDQKMLLVRQYRSVVEHETLELPSGHVDEGESPEQAARRELLEETGYVAGPLELLGTLVPDVGRLSNRMWCYFAGDVAPSAVPVESEPGLTVVLLPVDEALACANDGRIDHALNIAPLFLALAQRKLSLG
jgi:ADP-ribose pyrophosphatase